MRDRVPAEQFESRKSLTHSALEEDPLRVKMSARMKTVRDVLESKRNLLGQAFEGVHLRFGSPVSALCTAMSIQWKCDDGRILNCE